MNLFNTTEDEVDPGFNMNFIERIISMIKEILATLKSYIPMPI